MRDDLLVPSPRELAGAIRRRWWLAILVAAGVFLLAAAYLGGDSASYAATAKVLTVELDDRPPGVSFVDTELQRLRSDRVVAAAAERLGRSPDVSVNQIGGSVFSIEASGSSPDVVEAVNAYAAAFVDVRRAELREQYEARAAAIRAQIAEVEQGGAGSGDPSIVARRLENLGEQLDETVIEGAGVDGAVRVFDEASTATTSTPSSRTATIAAGVLALLAGLLAPFAFDLLRGRINTRGDVERLVPGLRVVAATSAPATATAVPDDVALLVRLAVDATDPVAGGGLAVGAVGADPTPDALASALGRQLPGTQVVVAPSLTSADGVATAASAGRVVLTATAGRTRVSQLRDAVSQLEAIGTTVVGLVLSGVSPGDVRGTA